VPVVVENELQKRSKKHMNALAPAFLTSQVLNQNRRLIRRKKRSEAIGFPSHVHQQLSMGNTTEIDNMDIDHDDNDHVSLDHDEAYGQSRSGSSRHVAPHAEPSSLTDPLNGDIFMDHPAPSISPDPLPDDDVGMHIGENIDAEVYGLSNLRRSRRIADSVKKIREQRWGSNASVHFVDNREESDEEEEDIEDDESINDFDIDVDRDVASDEDDDDEMFAGPGQEGISLWDSLGEGFLTEASQLGMSMLFW
jgi:hypothetical protein